MDRQLSPTPWNAVPTKDKYLYKVYSAPVNDERYDAISGAKLPPEPDLVARVGGIDRAKANAELIANAPKLLQIAKKFEQLITRDSPDLGFHLAVVPICIDLVKELRDIIRAAQ